MVYHRLRNIVRDLSSRDLSVLQLTTLLPAQWLDVYEVGETQLKHVQRASVIPTGKIISRSQTKKVLAFDSRNNRCPRTLHIPQ